MSHLKLIRVEIHGFRKFREPWTIDLLSPAGEPLDYLVLAGPNGCGKTTVLEAILLALGREELIVRDAPNHRRSKVRHLDPGGRLRLWVRDTAENREIPLERTAKGFDSPAWKSVSRAFKVEYISSRRLPALVGPVQDSIKGRRSQKPKQS